MLAGITAVYTGPAAAAAREKQSQSIMPVDMVLLMARQQGHRCLAAPGLGLAPLLQGCQPQQGHRITFAWSFILRISCRPGSVFVLFVFRCDFPILRIDRELLDLAVLRSPRVNVGLLVPDNLYIAVTSRLELLRDLGVC